MTARLRAALARWRRRRYRKRHPEPHRDRSVPRAKQPYVDRGTPPDQVFPGGF